MRRPGRQSNKTFANRLNTVPAKSIPTFRCPVHDRPFETACQHCRIRQVAVCGALSDVELLDLEAIMTHRVLGPQQTLAIEGDRAAYAYNVVSGGLKIFKGLPDGRTQMVGYLMPGDFLGLPRHGTYAYSADSTARTELCQFPRDRLISVFDRHHKLQERVLTVVHDELAAAQDHMLLLGRKSAIERLSSFLLALQDRLGRLGMPADPMQLPLHRDEIADYLGLTIETVSRSFTRLRTNGIIRLEKKNLVSVLDRPALEEVSGAS